MQHRYTLEQKAFIREIAPGRYNAEITDLFNRKFETSCTVEQIKCFKANHKISSDVPRIRITKPDTLFSFDQVEFIMNNVNGLLNQDLTDLVNETFNLSITVKQMKSWKKNNKVNSGLKGSEGMSPPNKGTKGVYNVGGSRTSFKKGQQAINYKSVGYERIDKDGYVLVKVQDDGPWHKRWRHKHKVLWEEAYGPIPKGHAIVFGDRDRKNLDLDNFVCVSRAQLAILNNFKLIQREADLTRTGVIIADMYMKISDRKKIKDSVRSER